MRTRPSIFGIALWSVLALATAAPAAAKGKGKHRTRKAAPAASAPTADASTKKAAELLVDDRAINKQMQWEDKVMGSNSAKKAELAKIARAAAITKAAEQAAAEKAAAAPAAPPAAAPRSNKAAAALPTLADEGPAKKNDRAGKTREISPALSTSSASAPVAASRPADDKFIDRILASDGKKHGSARDDGELEQLLTEKSGAKHKGKRKDMVDDLLEGAGKNAPPPAIPSSAGGMTAEALEPLPTPPPMHVTIKKVTPVKRDDGIIHVVQGANYAVPNSASRPAPQAKAEPKLDPSPAKTAAWNDPFADRAPSRRVAAAATTTISPRADSTPVPPAASTPPASSPATRAVSPVSPSSDDWKDPFAEPDGAKAKRPAAAPPVKGETKPDKADSPPAKPPGWKDPFADARHQGEARKGDLALSTTTPGAAALERPEPRWKASPRHARAAVVDGHARWSVIKKR